MADAARIRDARAEDATAVAALWTEAYVVPGGGRTLPYSEADFFDFAGRATALVADRDGELLGVVVLFAPHEKGVIGERGEAELSRLAVALRARRAGLGRALALRCEQLARSSGWRAIALWSRPAQTEAHRLYESLGYRRVPERDSADAGGERLVFRLALTD
jgi:ribosomal protein S18 acetylase RimI-like enzyme